MKFSFSVTKIKARLRHRKLTRLGILPVDVPLDTPTTAYGNRTGVWPVCETPDNTGHVVYSFGVGDNISFELDLIKACQAQIYAFDPTPQTVSFMRSQTLPPSLHYEAVGLADHCGEVAFYIPRRQGRFNYSVVKRGAKYPGETVNCPVKDFKTLCQEFGHSHVDILKLDVEGSEMSTLPGILESGVSIGQLLVEFHYNYPGIELSDTQALIKRIRQCGFNLFWCSQRGYEFGFVHQSVLGLESNA